MQTGRRVDLSKYLQTKLNEQKRERENEAWKKTASPPKMAETVPTLTITEASSSSTTTRIAMASVQGKEQVQPKKKE